MPEKRNNTNNMKLNSYLIKEPSAKSAGRQKSKQIYSVIVRLDPRIKHAL